jgi:hypothetical protein
MSPRRDVGPAVAVVEVAVPAFAVLCYGIDLDVAGSMVSTTAEN